MEKFRTRLILNYLREHQNCTFTELMNKLKVSRATIHRDVTELSRRDAVQIVRGGIVLNAPINEPEPTDAYAERVVTNRKDKIAVAKKAIETIVDGDIIFLDSSTTVYEMAMLLKASKISRLTIITNSLAVMQNFRKFPREWVMIGLGGNYDSQLNSILGATALNELKGLNLTKAYLSAFGLDNHNATTNHERQAELLKAVIAATEHNYLLIDKSKLKRTGLYHLAPRSAFDRIFT